MAKGVYCLKGTEVTAPRRDHSCVLRHQGWKLGPCKSVRHNLGLLNKKVLFGCGHFHGGWWQKETILLTNLQKHLRHSRAKTLRILFFFMGCKDEAVVHILFAPYRMNMLARSNSRATEAYLHECRVVESQHGSLRSLTSVRAGNMTLKIQMWQTRHVVSQKMLRAGFSITKSNPFEKQ